MISLHLFLLFSLIITMKLLSTAFVGTIVLLASTTFAATLDSRKLQVVEGGHSCYASHDDPMKGLATCQKLCDEKELQPICVDGACYCTNVGDGDCESDNGEGCKAVCKELDRQMTSCNKNQCSCTEQ